MQADLLRVRDAALGYGGHIVLSRLDFTVERGDLLGVMGPNGSGKTTLLRSLLGLIKPLKGTLEWVAQNGSPPRLGYVPQRERLDPHFPLSSLEVAVMGRFGRLGAMRRAGRADVEMALGCLVRVGIGRLAHSPYRSLSGGQQQRVLIARALAGEPDALLLDEPTNGMDIEAERAIMELLLDLQRTNATTILFVTHLLSAIQNFARRVALITRDGSLAIGPKAEMLAPASLARAYTEGA